MIHTLEEQKVDAKYIILKYKPKPEQNALYIKHILPILRLKTMEYFYPKLCDGKVQNYLKKKVMSASECWDFHTNIAGLCFHTAFPLCITIN